MVFSDTPVGPLTSPIPESAQSRCARRGSEIAHLLGAQEAAFFQLQGKCVSETGTHTRARGKFRKIDFFLTGKHKSHVMGKSRDE